MQIKPVDINNLKNLNSITSVTREVEGSQITSKKRVTDEKYFQIFLVEINKDSKDVDFSNLFEMEQSGYVTTKLVYGKKKDLISRYLGVNCLPSQGVKIDTNFSTSSSSDNDEQDNSIQHTVRILLQGRKISQMMAVTWLEAERIKKYTPEQVGLVRGILNSYNIVTDTHWLRDNNEISPKLASKELARSLSDVENEYLDYLIKPEYANYNSIRLALLLSGQAYYKYKDNSRCNRIWEPIFSTYEMVWRHAFDVSWDTFILVW
ncbi:hypothetical protein [Scytonema sp. PRP1]|uniref:hypothetical protein n=1 Tax=Scytonema sp. PRP1 TaxID=3120513 RepID=UPI002FD08D13